MTKTQNYIWKSDRSLAVNDLKDQLYYYVAEHNDLITKARHDLTARELKIMDFIISKIKPTDSTFLTVKTSMYELSNILDLKRNGKNYSDLAKNLEKLRQKSVVIYDEEKKSITQTGWLLQSKYWENGQVEMLLSKDLEPYLLNLKANYTQYLLADTVQLNSKYAILLYKLMRECDMSNGTKIAILEGTPEDYKEWLGAPKSYDYSRLKDKILKPAIEEINLKIEDMDLEILQKKSGRRVVCAAIRNNFTHESLNNSDEPKVPLFNWLTEKK